MPRKDGQIACDLANYIQDYSPQIDVETGKINYVFTGSFAIHLLSEATDLCDGIANNSHDLILGETMSFDKSKWNTICSFRKMGKDIDVLNLFGEVDVIFKIPYSQRSKMSDKIPNGENIVKKIPDYLELFSGVGKTINNSRLQFDVLNEDEQQNFGTRGVSIITTSRGKYIISSLPEMISSKLRETIIILLKEKNVEKYNKDLSDVYSLLLIGCQLYTAEDLIDKISDIWFFHPINNGDGRIIKSYEQIDNSINVIMNDIIKKFDLSNEHSHIVEILNKIFVSYYNKVVFEKTAKSK